MNDSPAVLNRRLVRDLALAIVFKLVVLGVLWQAFFHDHAAAGAQPDILQEARHGN
ncbi:hypothetical protein NX773_08530 [Massilia solisilvae]|uniref:Uncharacterized protein n=1 Tax=Massilia solisilvae TaxID=1811225 RepID=A0ABT2BJY1_9BURK|nr:cytochrome oxidase putative small subunit CydP [Massilia solisilvae]MCS0608208.1 hypothetical protein [Massilia solisilvae]